jgi:hypothetical protein
MCYNIITIKKKGDKKMIKIKDKKTGGIYNLIRVTKIKSIGGDLLECWIYNIRSFHRKPEQIEILEGKDEIKENYEVW